MNPEKMINNLETESREAEKEIETENSYDQKASENEVVNLQKEIEEKVKEKAEELGITKEKLIGLAGLDLESLEAEKLKALDLKQGELEFIRNSIDQAINEFQKSEKANTVLKEAPSSIDKLLKFVREHKKIVSVGQLALYLSSFGSPALSALAGEDAKVKIKGEKISLKDLADNPELIKKVNQTLNLPIEEGQESFSKKLTGLYEEVKDLPDKNIKYENLEESLEEANKFFNYAELIQNGEKKDLNNLADNLKDKETDVILFGEYHGPKSNAVNTVEVLKKLQDRNCKIANIAFEFLSYNDPKAVELTEQFNNKEISVENFYYSGHLYARSDIKPILEFAQNNNIPITGIESSEHSFSYNNLSRFTDISHRVGKIAEHKKEGEITAVFVGARHTTESNFNLDDPITSKYRENREKIDEKDYTIKEYLEELDFKPAVINLDEWKEFAKVSDEYFRESYNKLEGKNASLFGNYCVENWKKYKLDQKNIFVVDHGKGKNVYSVVSPSEIAEVPPSLNVLKGIEDNYSTLKKIMHKQGVFISYENNKISLEYNGEKMDVAQIDSETGQIKKIFLPEIEKYDNEKNYETVYSKELSEIYKEISKTSEKEREFEDLQSSIELAKKSFEYPKTIKGSEKKPIDDFIKDLSKEEFDNLIIGEWHGFGPTEQEAAHIIEEYIKNGGKVSAICFERLSFTIPEDVKAARKFNEGNLSIQEMSKFAGFKNSLLETAKNHSIEVVGIERRKGLVQEDYYGRFKSISERVGEVTKEKKDNGVVVVYIGQGHVTTDSWENDNLLSELKKGKPAYPSREKALENNYTLKEYLEKIGLKPIALQVEDWNQLTKAVDSSLAGRFKNLPEEDKIKFYEFSKKNWANYDLEENEIFVTKYPKGKDNTFSVIIPNKIPKSPPLLNGYNAVYDNPYLAEMLNKEGLGSISYEPNIVFYVKQVPIVEINKNTGELMKIYLPEQAKKDAGETHKKFDNLVLQEKLREMLMTYDPKLHQRERKIEEVGDVSSREEED